MSAPYRELTETLAKELTGRLKEDDSTVPLKDKDYLYSVHFEAGKQHPIHVGRPVGLVGCPALIEGCTASPSEGALFLVPKTEHPNNIGSPLVSR